MSFQYVSHQTPYTYSITLTINLHVQPGKYLNGKQDVIHKH